MRNWFRLRLRHKIELDKPLEDFDDFEKIGKNLTPNLRALRLAVTACETLLSMGVPANSVVSRALDITETYCRQPVHFEIIANIIIITQLRGLEREPLTMMRQVPLRDVNNMTVQSVQELVYEIKDGRYNLSKAEGKLDVILSEPITYPKWLVSVANASIAAAVTLMFTTNWRMVVVTFIIALMVDQLNVLLVKKALVTFYRQIAAGALVTIAAALIALLARSGIGFFAGMNPTIIVVGGIIMLVAGLAFVSSIQDSIEEYYITASSRGLRVVMLTTGVVIGVLLGLYIARRAGFGIAVSPNPLSLTAAHFQVIGGALAAAAFALATQSRIRAVAWAGILGGGALFIMYLSRHLDISPIPATGIAALFVGFVAALFSRKWKTPVSGVVAAGIVPLVPGLSLYNSLMQIVNYPPGNPLFIRGLGTLFTAIGIAVAIAAGASFGSILGRPIHRQLTHARNHLPFDNFARWQLNADHKSRLARFALGRAFLPLFGKSHHDEEDD